MSNFRQDCIYCGKPGRSKEHIWGKWLSKHLPPIQLNTVHSVSYFNVRTGEFSAKEGRLNRQGAPRRAQIKGPCQKCNNGWMSENITHAKDVIIRLINEGPFEMSKENSLAFSNWATMCSMTYEFSSPELVVSTPQDRLNFMENRQPPADWAILIGQYDGSRWREQANHRALGSDIIDGNMLMLGQRNVFTLGKTAVVTLSGEPAKFQNVRLLSVLRALRIVWPIGIGIPMEKMQWPLGDDQLDNLAFAIE